MHLKSMTHRIFKVLTLNMIFSFTSKNMIFIIFSWVPHQWNEFHNQHKKHLIFLFITCFFQIFNTACKTWRDVTSACYFQCESNIFDIFNVWNLTVSEDIGFIHWIKPGTCILRLQNLVKWCIMISETFIKIFRFCYN